MKILKTNFKTFIDNNLSSKNAFYLRRFSFLQAHYFLISIKYHLVIIQATKGFHYQMHPLIIMNSSTIPKSYT